MIGVYDSGLGGLTALKELRRLIPREDIIYFGDTENLPYGTRSQTTIKRYAVRALKFLTSMGACSVLCACGTVSSVALPELQKQFDIPITGVIEPAVRAAVNASASGKIGVIGTSATISSGEFAIEINRMLHKAEVISKPCDIFVSIVENGLAQNQVITEEAARLSLDGLEGCDTLILGCTHFPILRDAIEMVMPRAKQINCAKEAARDAMRYTSGKGNGRTEFYLSDTGGSFAEIAKRILNEKNELIIKKADIESYER